MSMRGQRRPFVVLRLLYLAPLIVAQNVATITDDPQPTTMSGAPLSGNSGSMSLVTASSTPTPHDNAPSPTSAPNPNTSGLVNYYFVFIALILCLVALLVFFLLRRRRKMLARSYQNQREAGDASIGGWATWDPERRRYWHGRWRSAETSREEGLNEHGEAPPPYIPKTSSEVREMNGQPDQDGPAVPLQTLSRDDAGLKPPDYTEAQVAETTHPRDSTSSGASASHPRAPDTRTGP